MENNLDYLKKYKKNYTKEDIEKLKENYPVQYLVGNIDFLNINLKVDERALIPRFETELLVEKTNNYIKEFFDEVDILDIGTGSGCIAIALKKENNDYNITAIDISEDAIELAKENAKKNNCEMDIYQSDLFDKVEKNFDVIISNPPYVKNDEEVDPKVHFEPQNALYAADEGLEFYEKIIFESEKYLKNKNLIAFETGMTQGPAIKGIVQKKYPKAKIIIEKDLQNRDRFVFICNKC